MNGVHRWKREDRERGEEGGANLRDDAQLVTPGFGSEFSDVWEEEKNNQEQGDQPSRPIARSRKQGTKNKRKGRIERMTNLAHRT
jgi:hypothetical protein